MKTRKMIFTTLIITFCLVSNLGLQAQDPVKAASNVYKKVLLENDQVRVLQVEFAPGESTAWHSHPDHVVYALTEGKLEITDKDKPASVITIKAGDTMFLPAVTHMAKNIGTTTIKLVVTELKPMKM
jgi:beta-alanine degradation protein BauB